MKTSAIVIVPAPPGRFTWFQPLLSCASAGVTAVEFGATVPSALATDISRAPTPLMLTYAATGVVVLSVSVPEATSTDRQVHASLTVRAASTPAPEPPDWAGTVRREVRERWQPGASQ